MISPLTNTPESWGRVDEAATDHYFGEGCRPSHCPKCDDAKNLFMYTKNDQYMVGCCLCSSHAPTRDTVRDAVMSWIQFSALKGESPICAEHKLPHGMCWWCNGQANPTMRSIYKNQETLLRTEVWWKCSCGQEWPIGDTCAAIASRIWKNEVVHLDDSKKTFRYERWYPRHTTDNPNGNRRFTEEVLKDEREMYELPRDFGRRFTYRDEDR